MMTPEKISDQELLAKLNEHPNLKHQIYSLLLSIEDETGQFKQADVAELQLIERMREMGNVSLQAWAAHRHDEELKVFEGQRGLHKDGKKN